MNWDGPPSTTARCDIPLLASNAVPRWRSNTQERLVRAALDLYVERGYEHTTIGGIAECAGVTARTYFRYFPDKREVLFASGDALREAIVAGTGRAMASHPPFAAVLLGFGAGQEVFLPREFVRKREAVIATSEELRERQLMKTASIAAELQSVLTESGCPPATARMAAEAGIAVFTEAIHRWQDGDDTPFDELLDQAALLLRQTTAS